jgi:hypothetical protein
MQRANSFFAASRAAREPHVFAPNTAPDRFVRLA